MAEQKWGYEGQGKRFDSELNRKVLMGSLITVVLVSLGGVIFARGVFGFLLGGMENSDPAPSPRVEAMERRLPPEPRLQNHPETELAEMRTAEAHQLNSYAWEDESRGIARVPIERAMQMVAEHGVPTWPEVDANGDPVDSNAGGGR